MNYTKYDSNVVIPSTVVNKELGWTEASSVTVIGPDIFRNRVSISVTLPDTLKVISERAFYNNKLSRIDIPDSVVTIYLREVQFI